MGKSYFSEVDIHAPMELDKCDACHCLIGGMMCREAHLRWHLEQGHEIVGHDSSYNTDLLEDIKNG